MARPHRRRGRPFPLPFQIAQILIILISFILVFLPMASCKLKSSFLSRQTRQAPAFCYELPSCAPNTWPGICNGGTQQSPIDLDNPSQISVLPPTFREFYEPLPLAETSTFLIQNTGHSIEVLFPPGTEPDLRGKTIALPGDYRFAQLHFHWGRTDNNGTEHRLGGKAFALELHIVHYSTVYPNYVAASVAPNDPNAIAIVGILFEVGLLDNLAIKPITDAIPLVRTYNAGMDVPVNGFLNLRTLYPSISNFYRYEGSLTTPDCHENRVWTVFKGLNRISNRQLALFRSVFEDNNVDLIGENHRPLQARNGRPVTLFIVTTSLADWITNVAVRFYTWFRAFVFRPFRFLLERMRPMAGSLLNRFTVNNFGFVSFLLK